MANGGTLADVLSGQRYQKTVLIICIVALLFIEIAVFIAALNSSGKKSRVIIYDKNGYKVFETEGTTLSAYEKVVFENNFGPLSNYHIKIESEKIPFPFRAWLAAAVGIPIGLVLIIAFIIKAYLALLYGDSGGEVREEARPRGAVGSFFSQATRISIFPLGVTVLILVLLMWMVPNFLGEFARLSVNTIREFKWFFLGVSIFLAALICWVIYLRYKLSKQAIENEKDIEKYRLEIKLLEEKKDKQLLLE